MAEGKKSGLDELRKSFPSLDGHSARTLLGGGGEIPGPFIGWNEDGSPVYGDPFPPPQPPPGGNSESGGPLSTSPVSTGGSSGSDYFGDWDDDYGDFGWGEGWGDYDGGTDSNPDGSEGGNGQNSSGNPGDPGQEEGGLQWNNISTPTQRPYKVQNNNNFVIYAKPEDNFTGGIPNFFYIPSGGTTNIPIDGLKINGIVYKFVDGYGWVQVNPGSFTTNYSTGGSILQYWGGGVLDSPPDPTWQDLFDAP